MNTFSRPSLIFLSLSFSHLLYLNLTLCHHLLWPVHMSDWLFLYSWHSWSSHNALLTPHGYQQPNRNALPSRPHRIQLRAVSVTCHIIVTRHEAECHCALSAVDSSSLPAVVCELPRRTRRSCRLNYSIWKVCEGCFTECDEGAEGKVFTYSFIPLLLHSRKPSITAWGGAGGNRKWMLSAVVTMETL